MKENKTIIKQEPNLTQNAIGVLEKRYLLRDKTGRICETPAELFKRVASVVAGAEKYDRDIWLERFYNLMVSKRFMPNSPTLMNAGKQRGQLSACFVLPVEDSLESIFEALKFTASIHQSGGGTGFSFSKLRPRNSIVGSTQGVASGPVSFIKIFDITTETIKQGGARRGANMAVLRVDHPDIIEFIDSKRDFHSITNFNISVGVTNEFMRAVMLNSKFVLRNPTTGKKSHSIKAGELFSKITQAAWECGDPGLIFLDRINIFNPTPNEGVIESTNPCGEQPLLSYESCNLGSLNVLKYLNGNDINWEDFRSDIRIATRFLDNVIDVNKYPIEACRKITLRNRKIGLGIMGFADLLLAMSIPYDSQEARFFGQKIMSFLDREAKRYSTEMAIQKGVFPNWHRSIWKKLGYPPMRNSTVSTVAPTGTVSIIAGVTGGIEPIFSARFYRNILGGEKLIEIHPAIKNVLRASSIKAKEASRLSNIEISNIIGAA